MKTHQDIFDSYSEALRTTRSTTLSGAPLSCLVLGQPSGCVAFAAKNLTVLTAISIRCVIVI